MLLASKTLLAASATAGGAALGYGGMTGISGAGRLFNLPGGATGLGNPFPAQAKMHNLTPPADGTLPKAAIAIPEPSSIALFASFLLVFLTIRTLRRRLYSPY
jgi:hypothetical protein